MRGDYVMYCSDEAWQGGVRVGMPLSEAGALMNNRSSNRKPNHCHSSSAQLPLTMQHNPDADRCALQELAHWCQRFSPWVALELDDEPSSLLLDMTGLEPLLGHELKVSQQVGRAFERLGYKVQLGFGDHVGTAWAAAHYGNLNTTSPWLHEANLSNLPVEALRLPNKVLDLMASLGISQVHQLQSLPRPALASRLGQKLVQRLGQIEGSCPEVLIPYQPPPEFQFRWVAEHPIANHQSIHQALYLLIERLANQLLQRQQGAMELECQLICQVPTACQYNVPHIDQIVDGKTGTRNVPVVLKIGLFQPRATVDHLEKLVQIHLEQLRLPGPVCEILLRATATAKLKIRQGELFDDPSRRQAQQLATLVERLEGRLGQKAIVGARLNTDILPERVVCDEKLTGLQARSSRRAPSHSKHLQTQKTAYPTIRPLQLHTPPVPLEIIAVVPDGPPIRFRIRGQISQVSRHWGPERIETGWWRGKSVRRDYYRVETTHGNRLWLFRCLEDGQWFLHGSFT